MTIFISISTPSSFHTNAKKSLKKKPASVILEQSLSLDKIKRKRNTATNNRQSNDSKFIRYQHNNIKNSVNDNNNQTISKQTLEVCLFFFTKRCILY